MFPLRLRKTQPWADRITCWLETSSPTSGDSTGYIRRFPEMGVLPNHTFLIIFEFCLGFSLKYTIYCWVLPFMDTSICINCQNPSQKKAPKPSTGFPLLWKTFGSVPEPSRSQRTSDLPRILWWFHGNSMGFLLGWTNKPGDNRTDENGSFSSMMLPVNNGDFRREGHCQRVNPTTGTQQLDDILSFLVVCHVVCGDSDCSPLWVGCLHLTKVA